MVGNRESTHDVRNTELMENVEDVKGRLRRLAGSSRPSWARPARSLFLHDRVCQARAICQGRRLKYWRKPICAAPVSSAARARHAPFCLARSIADSLRMVAVYNRKRLLQRFLAAFVEEFWANRL